MSRYMVTTLPALILMALATTGCKEDALDRTYGLRLTQAQVARLEHLTNESLELAHEWRAALQSAVGRSEPSSKTRAWLLTHPMRLELFALQLTPFIPTASFPPELQNTARERVDAWARATLDTSTWAYEQAHKSTSRGEHYLLLEGLSHRSHGWALRMKELLQSFLGPDQIPRKRVRGTPFLSEEVLLIPPHGVYSSQWVQRSEDSATFNVRCRTLDSFHGNGEVTVSLPHSGRPLVSGVLNTGEYWRAVTLNDELSRRDWGHVVRAEIRSEESEWLSCRARRFLKMTEERESVPFSRKKRKDAVPHQTRLAMLDSTLAPALANEPELRAEWSLLRQGIAFELAVSPNARFDGVPFEHYYRMRFEAQARKLWREWLHHEDTAHAFGETLRITWLEWLETADALAKTFEP